MDYSNFYNKTIILFLAICLFTACDPLKKVQDNSDTNTNNDQLDEIEGRRVYNPETGKYEVVTDVTGEMEEIEWRDGNTTGLPPISSETTDRIGFPDPNSNNNPNIEEGQKLYSYNMVLALPFMTNENYSFDSEINAKSIPAINFYEGAKMAFDRLSQEEINLQVNVLDTKASEGNTKELLYNPALQGAHLIIGTFRNSTAKVMADFALENQKPFVSPYYPHNALVEGNPYFIQLNPSIITHCDAVMRYLKSKYSNGQIVLVGRNTRREQGIIDLYQRAHYKYAGTSSIAPLKTVIITDNSSTLEETNLKEHFLKGQPTVFVIASSQESFVYAVLRKLDIEKKNFDEKDNTLTLDDDELVVFGQPRWKDFTRVSYDYYEKLNLHITSESYLDPLSEPIQSFKQAFFDRYGAIPTEEAYKGFDTVLYFGRLLSQQGTGFINTIDQFPKNGLHNEFTINRVLTKQRPVDDANLALFDQLENTHVHILAFENYRFVVVE